MRYSAILFLLVFIFLSACEPKKSFDSTNEQTKTNTENTKNTADSAPLVYDNFEDMEYIFRYENDTTYVINFWATWCKPCVKELPYFEKLHDEYINKKVKIILVSLDFPKQIQTKLVPFMHKNNIKSDVMVLTDGDANTWVSKVDKEWDGAIPVTLVYNKNKRDFIYGDVSDYRELQSRIEPLIN